MRQTPGAEVGAKFAVAVIAVLALSGISATHAAAQTVGMVTKVQNQAQVGGQAAVVGSLVGLNDTLQTGANARLQVTFRDNTNLTLGENAKDHQPAFMRQRFQEITGALRVVDHSVEFVGTRAAFQVMQFH